MLPGHRDWMAKPPHLAPFHAKELLQAPQMSELLPPSLPPTPSPATIRLRGTSFRLLDLEDTTQSSNADGLMTPCPKHSRYHTKQPVKPIFTFTNLTPASTNSVVLDSSILEATLRQLWTFIPSSQEKHHKNGNILTFKTVLTVVLVTLLLRSKKRGKKRGRQQIAACVYFLKELYAKFRKN